jgi:hypothetical protein
MEARPLWGMGWRELYPSSQRTLKRGDAERLLSHQMKFKFAAQALQREGIVLLRMGKCLSGRIKPTGLRVGEFITTHFAYSRSLARRLGHRRAEHSS